MLLEQPVEMVLEQQVETAVCRARCWGQEEHDLCLEICQLVLTETGLELCDYPQLCTAPCQAACSGPAPAPPTAFTGFRLGRCGLEWEQEGEVGRTQFLLAGLDEAGMLSLLQTGPARAVSWQQRGLARFSSLSLLAVGENGVLDTLDIALPESFKTSEFQCRSEEENKFNIVTVILIAVIALFSILAVALVFCKRPKSYKSASLESLIREI